MAHLDDSPAVVECKKHFNIKYAFDIYNYIFKGKKIDDFSCWALVVLGRWCHNVFVNNTFTYEHTGNRTVIQARADRLFNHFCALPTMAHLDDSLAVVECKKHFRIKYAFDVYNYIFKGKKIDDFSCRALVALGRWCHNVFVNSTFTYEHTRNRTVIQARADRLFNHCTITIVVILLLASCALPKLAHLDDSRVVECKKYFSIKYAFDVYNIFSKKIGDFSCRTHVSLGRPCHNVFVNNTFTYEHTGNIIVIQARADRVFNICIIATSIPPPSSLS
ncbi:unnamed protein product [Malus baccata var. baccata]